MFKSEVHSYWCAPADLSAWPQVLLGFYVRAYRSFTSSSGSHHVPAPKSPCVHCFRRWWAGQAGQPGQRAKRGRQPAFPAPLCLHPGRLQAGTQASLPDHLPQEKRKKLMNWEDWESESQMNFPGAQKPMPSFLQGCCKVQAGTGAHLWLVSALLSISVALDSLSVKWVTIRALI